MADCKATVKTVRDANALKPVGVEINGFDIPNLMNAQIVTEANRPVKILLTIMPDELCVKEMQ